MCFGKNLRCRRNAKFFLKIANITLPQSNQNLKNQSSFCFPFNKQTDKKGADNFCNKKSTANHSSAK